MNKQKADKILIEYLPRIYGFAVKKSFSYDEAEEICADIVKELYESLLKSKEIYNLDAMCGASANMCIQNMSHLLRSIRAFLLIKLIFPLRMSTISEIMKRNFCACAVKLHF